MLFTIFFWGGGRITLRPRPHGDGIEWIRQHVFFSCRRFVHTENAVSGAHIRYFLKTLQMWNAPLAFLHVCPLCVFIETLLLNTNLHHHYPLILSVYEAMLQHHPQVGSMYYTVTAVSCGRKHVSTQLHVNVASHPHTHARTAEIKAPCRNNRSV